MGHPTLKDLYIRVAKLAIDADEISADFLAFVKHLEDASKPPDPEEA